MSDIDLKPTTEMASNAARGLELREKHGRGGDAGKAWAERKDKELDRKEEKIVNAKTSHTVAEDGDKVMIERVELFMAFDPAIDDGEADPELKRFNNQRLRDIVASTRKHMARGSFPRLVIMHEKDGKEPKSAVGRFPTISYEERDGIGYIVGDMEVNRNIFDAYIATNAFPRRSAEIWSGSNHLSEVALLGRETPRRPLPDTHFTRKGEKITCSKSNHDLVGVGGGLNTFVPTTTKEEASMASSDDMREELEAMKCAISELSDMMKKKFADDSDDKDEMAADDDEMKDEMAEEDGQVHIDIESHDVEAGEDEDEAESVVASRSTYALRSENARLKSRFARLEAELKREKFEREVEIMEQEGYRIPDSQREALVGQLQASRNPVALLESWRDLFARDPIGTKIDMSRAALPRGMDIGDVGSLVKQFAGKPEEFAKAINARMKG